MDLNWFKENDFETSASVGQKQTVMHRKKSYLSRILSLWRNDVANFSALLALCVENPSVTVESTHKGSVMQSFDIQIKICAEYRDMLPRPRLVCQKPGLRLIGRSPGVPDKSSRGLGSMSRYSAQILICFIAYIFHFLNSSVGLVGNFAELPVCTVPSAIVHCNHNEAGHQTIKAPSMPCWGAAGPSKHFLAFMPQTVEIDR